MRSPHTGSSGRRRSRSSTAFLLTAALGGTLLVGAPAVFAADGRVAAAGVPDLGTDITGNGGGLTVQYPGSGAETERELIDDDVSTKYFAPYSSVWMRYRSDTAVTIDRYTLTSAGDAPDRDPAAWVLEGSRDGSAWTVLDSRKEEKFSSRKQTRGFAVATTTAYTQYRLTVTKNNGSPHFQLAEWELWSGGNGVPAAPSGLAASSDGDGALLRWKDNSGPDTGYTETGFRIERSQDGSPFTQVAIAGTDAQSFTDPGLKAGTRYTYRVRAVGAGDEPSEYSNTAELKVGVVADITDLPGTVSDRYDTGGNEGHDRSADNSPYTKYLSRSPATWLQYRSEGRSKVTSYTLTSANDAPDRDPRDWVLRASDDGVTWTDLDTRSGQVFQGRFQKKSYSFDNTGSHRYFRLDITANRGSSSTQLAEWELLGTGTGAPPATAPGVPSALTATARSGDQISLSWAGESRIEQSFRLERSVNGTDWDWSRILPTATTLHTDLGLRADTTYHYRLRAQNAAGASAYTAPVVARTLSSALPATWQEHWLEHNQLLTKVYDNNEVAVYFDKDMDRSQTWLYDYVDRLWKYTKLTYGNFSSERLAVVFHKDKYGGGHPSTVLDADHDYRNVIDVGYGTWSEGDGQLRDVISHEIAHVVEFSAGGVEGSPAFPVWGDSKWAEIFQYDAYLGAGLTADAQRYYANVINRTDGYPRADTAWFRDWFLPIWQNHGRSKVLGSFFRLASQRYSQHNGSYAKDMNMGEFVHFWSGAAGIDLTGRARTAFGWTDEYEAQLRQARIDFTGLPYSTA